MRGLRVRVSVSVAVGLMTVGAFLAPASARQKPPPPLPSGFDISYPQCNHPFPTNATFGIVGVGNGIVLSTNPCLGTGDGPSELGWAEQATNHAASFYANTGNPGPAYSSHWPVGQQSPQLCSSTATNSTACAYDYGWNAAQASFSAAVTAEEQVNRSTSPTATAAAAAAPWWLDVETGNSWETLEAAYGQTAAARQSDTAALSGQVAALQAHGVSAVGFYSTAFQWSQITGGATFAGAPDWVAGFTSVSGAAAGCTAAGFSGGVVQLTQYPANGFDADYRCP